MSNSRNLADLLTSTGDVKSDALDNVDSLPTQTSNSGKVLMSDGTDASWVSAGRKNLIINGGMDVSQRGTSSTNVSGTGYFACDRVKFWSASSTSDARWTVSQDTDAPEGFGSSYKLDCTTADATPNASYYGLLRVGLTEGQDMLSSKFGTSSAEALTLSFWVKSNITGSQQVLFVSHDSQKHAGDIFTITSADTWEKKVITISGDTNPANGFSNDNSLGFSIDMLVDAGSNYTGGTALSDSWVSRVDADKAVNNLSLGASTSNYFQITGVQLELGSVATDFEHRSYGEELALCQRYYWQMTDQGNIAQFIMTGVNSGSVQISFFPPVPFRDKPTIGLTSTTPYWESYPWNTVGTSITGATVHNGHFNSYGGEFLLSGTFSPAPTRGTNYTIDAEAFTFNAEL